MNSTEYAVDRAAPQNHRELKCCWRQIRGWGRIKGPRKEQLHKSTSPPSTSSAPIWMSRGLVFSSRQKEAASYLTKRNEQLAKANIFFFKDLLIDWLLCWVFISVLGLSPVAASGGHSSSRCAGLSLSRPLLLRSTGSRRSGSVVVAHRPSCSVACGIFPDQGLNPCPLH